MKFKKDLVFKFYDDFGPKDDWAMSLNDLRRRISDIWKEIIESIEEAKPDKAGKIEFESAEEALVLHLIELIMVYFALADRDEKQREYLINQILYHSRALVRAIEKIREK